MAQSAVYPVEESSTLLPFLLAHVKGQSRNTVKNLLAKKQVLVDGVPVTQFDTPLTPGQVVSLLPRGVEFAALPYPVLYEDEQLIVIDKPAGLLSIATDKEKTVTAYHQVRDYRKAQDPAARIFVLHRLDRDTSGVLAFAKTEEAKRLFQDHWDKNVVERAYLVLVEGAPKEARGSVRSYLKETVTHVVYSVERPGGDAKEAITNYETLAKRGNYTLLRVTLDTGRKNQIRVHMKDLGCPVAGDKKYGAKSDPMHRLALHALSLKLKHPKTGRLMAFEAPAPKPFQKYMPK